MQFLPEVILQDYIKGENFIPLQNNRNIYYRDTHDVNTFLANPPQNPFVLVSHNSDGKITDSPQVYDADVKLMPDNLIRWYGQNVDTDNPRIEPIPIGLENSKWFVNERKVFKLQEIVKTEKHIRNLVYLNFNIATNSHVRQPIYDMLKHKKYITVEYGKNGMSFDNYLNNLYNHCFMICPEGHGIDVHQPWESLYVNTVPIQNKNRNNKNWRELPICWVEDWGQLEDENFLLSEYDRITNGNFDKSKLSFTYWKNKILNTL